MIGAVRHKGFIPWDNDIDVCMVRDEYNKFIELILSGKCLDNDSYEVKIPLLSEDYIYPFIKIIDKRTIVYEHNIIKRFNIGLWIDVFPIDYIGNTKEEIRSLGKYMEYNCNMIMRKVNRRDTKDIISQIKNIGHWCSYKFGKNYKVYLDRIVNYNFPQHSKWVGLAVWTPYNSGIKGFEDKKYRSECVEKYTTAEFEGMYFMMFENYDEILNCAYGDYMKLPKEEEREVHIIQVYNV
jgi:lipopolysaccharide cholinephosphotransferase